MFKRPIKHTRLTTMNEVFNFSFKTDQKALAMTYCMNNGQVAFANEQGNVFVTPYRPEICELLAESGFGTTDLFVPYSNNEKRPEEYQWLQKIADEENWAFTYEEAYQFSQKKGILSLDLSIYKIHVKEICTTYVPDDVEDDISYSPMVEKYLLNDTSKNIGTYIIIDLKTIMVCDEYGRTFLIRAKTVINDIVNTLIDAGYTRTIHPEYYVHRYEHNPLSI